MMKYLMRFNEMLDCKSCKCSPCKCNDCEDCSCNPCKCDELMDNELERELDEYERGKYNEGKEIKKKEMTNANRRAVVRKMNSEIETNKDYKNLLSGEKEKFQDKLITKYCKELGFKLTDFYAADGKMLNKLLESREDREGTFDYFMTKSKEELLDYQKNFQHSFENPAEHDPKFVAWKKACEMKKCFPSKNDRVFKTIQKEPGFPSKLR